MTKGEVIKVLSSLERNHGEREEGSCNTCDGWVMPNGGQREHREDCSFVAACKAINLLYAERDELRRRVEEAPICVVCSDPGSYPWVDTRLPRDWIGKRVRLVVEK